VNQLTQQDIEVLEVLASAPNPLDLVELLLVLNLPLDSIGHSIGRLKAYRYVTAVSLWRHAATSAGNAALATLQADTELDPLALLYAGIGSAA
jgi:hypothetical protein